MNIWLSEIWQSWRASFRRPGFLLLGSGVLALGIGASVAVFTLIDNTLLRPLPGHQSSRLVVIGPIRDGNVGTTSARQYQQLAALKGVLSIGLKQAGSMANISGGGPPQQVPRIYADRQLLPTLGLHPFLGRNFTSQEDSPDGPKAVMLSYGFWQRRYGGNRNIIGRGILVEGGTRTIVGVLPASFNALAGTGDIVVPMALPTQDAGNGACCMTMARLADGGSKQSVSAEVDARLQALDRTITANDNPTQRTHYGVENLAAWQHRNARPVLILSLLGALVVLLIALVNLANLMLLRVLSRSHDAAVRNALGAPVLRLILPVLGEGLLVGVAGTVLGMVLAMVCLGVLQGFVPVSWLVDGRLHVGLQAWVLGTAMGVLGALFAAALGLWRSRSTTTVDALREGGRSGPSRHAGRLGRALVVAQVALATVLLCATGMVMHALYDASQLNLGFVGDNVLTFELAPVMSEYRDAAAVENLSQRLVRRLRVIPGVTAAAVTTNLPSSTDKIGSFGQFGVAMHVPGGTTFIAQYHGVGPGYFAVLSIPLHAGRYFTRHDKRGSEAVAIISQNIARKRYGGHALGKTIDTEGANNAVWPARIVGVVADTYQNGPLQPKKPVLYVPLAQMPESILAGFRTLEPLRFVMRGHGNPDNWRTGARKALTEIAPEQPIANLRKMHSIMHATTADARFNLLLISLFASLALLLAAAGMYAVMAVAVAAREREFGVRMALGAKPSRLMRLVLRGGLVQTVLGLAIGAAIVLAVSRPLQQMLIALVARRDTFDTMALIGVCAMLAAAGLLACLLPALRAARVQPMHALRGE